MVRFIIRMIEDGWAEDEQFTFQYGQIYYCNDKIGCRKTYEIYIPIWLDLLFFYNNTNYIIKDDLHSNMVRFIIRCRYHILLQQKNLHSNMVRFIIIETLGISKESK